jgi:hypothetical protein
VSNPSRRVAFDEVLLLGTKRLNHLFNGLPSKVLVIRNRLSSGDRLTKSLSDRTLYPAVSFDRCWSQLFILWYSLELFPFSSGNF